MPISPEMGKVGGLTFWTYLFWTVFMKFDFTRVFSGDMHFLGGSEKPLPLHLYYVSVNGQENF